MRTAEYYLIEEFEPGSKDCQTVRDDLRLAIIINPSLEKFEKAINEARKETIEECAKRAMICEEIILEEDEDNMEGEIEKSVYSGGYIRDENWVEVDKDSILSLIKEIK